MIKVGFDISQVAHSGGVAVYTDQLSRQLIEIDDLSMRFFYSSLRKPYKGDLKNVKTLSLPPTIFEILFNRFRVYPIESFIGSIDVFHSSDWTQPKTKAKKVTTYHDVVPLKYPEWSVPEIVAVHKRRLKLVEQEIDMVIAVSEATKKDLLEVSSIPESKIKVIYEAAGEEFRIYPQDEIEAFRAKMELPGQFLLGIGGVGERRNLKRLKAAAKDYDLIITGETIARVPSQDLPLLYSASSALVYPSFYEGFGLPILEAMACGVPVITSSVSSMPEIGGKAALYVNPNKTEDIHKKIDQLMRDPDLRAELIKKGLKQASSFSWQRCAEETSELYKSLIIR